MFIKSIVLDGFKSYAHRTEITGFDEQFNAITGLNGSGKSNILDSICFVLGISNLSQVRAANLQDLIFKSGQCGVTKATVSITFDNRNPDQCPPGFETVPEITITRQIMIGGKNKYMINGAIVPNKKVQDLFCSVQLNVNNPHFLIMQGKITKVLNMKPFEILAMIEEAAGTKMYEVKKQAAQKTIEKKDAKLKELRAVCDEELAPRLEKLRAERLKYMEFKTLERDLEDMMRLYQVWEFLASQRKAKHAEQILKVEEDKLKEFETGIQNHHKEIEKIDKEVKELTKKAESAHSLNLQAKEAELKDAEKVQAKLNAAAKSIKDNIDTEKKRKKQLEKNMLDDEKALRSKESELGKVQAMFQKLKAKDEEDNLALVASQKRFEALSAGMELNDDGEAETLLEQLMNARQSAAQANTEQKQSLMRLKFCQTQLNQKKKRRTSTAQETAKDEKTLEVAKSAVENLEASLDKLQFDEVRMNELQTRKRQLVQEIRELKRRVENFEMQRPYTQFRYTDPEPNFNRRSVYGAVCRLLKVKNDSAYIAIETAAGGRLYNVVIDTDVTGKKLLQRGELQQRTTFIPMNKIQASKMSDVAVRTAQELVGKENVQPALSHLQYDKKLQVVMEFIFGNVFVCKDINVARQVAFHDRIKRRCVTLDGDVADPAGTLSGGAPQKGGSVLKQLVEIQRFEEELTGKEQELERIEAEIRRMGAKEAEYVKVKQQLDIKQHDVQLITQRLQQTSHYQEQEEIANLTAEIEELQHKIETCKTDEDKFKQKVTDLEDKIKNSKGGREGQLKDAEKEMKRLKAIADKSRQAWQQKEQDYETFNLEIAELKKSLENTQQQIALLEEAVVDLQAKHGEAVENTQEVNETVERLQNEVRSEKGAIAEQNKDIQRKVHKKEELQGEVTDFEVKIKEQNHKLKKLREDCKHLKAKLNDCQKRTKDDKRERAETMTEEDGRNLEHKIRSTQEKKTILGRTVNSKAQTLFEQQDKEYNDLNKKQRIVEQDKRKIMQIINNLDVKKQEVLMKAFEQISKDFGSIFSTLLPGANAKLSPPIGQTILQGLEVKVSLGGVWKESLTELSGGQRSLAALSLILAMLLFKPAPLYILDEVDAALDLSHTQNIGSMLKTHFKKSQFIIVSLKDGMFSNANVLFRTQFVDSASAVTRTVNKKI